MLNKWRHDKNQAGFTLIELMVVVVVIAVIASIALPAFLDQVRKARRSDAKQSLMDAATRMEQYYQDNKGYPSLADGDDLTNIGYDLATNEPSPEGDYLINFVSSSATTYEIEAKPVTKMQKDDKECYSFRINHLGEKTNYNSSDAEISNNDNCW